MADLRDAAAPHRRDGTRGGAPAAHAAGNAVQTDQTDQAEHPDQPDNTAQVTAESTGPDPEPTAADEAAEAEAEAEELATALQALMTVLKQSRLHDYLLAEAGVDLDRAGTALLHVLCHSDGHLRIGDLAERLHVDAPSVSRTAARLERGGLIARSADDEDRRACRMDLTEAGRGAIDATLSARRAWLAAVLADWTPAERAGFARALHRFADGVDRHLEGHDAWKR